MDDGSENKKAKGTKYIICDKKKQTSIIMMIVYLITSQ